ncbi:uncharacterized protein LOC129951836 [Eupeodes corollae]|uniref:uncharacterized protein LOC129951836 n=1 Tax=Eupeodes corollae TaxID=290404 RepID=UPI00249360B1|nr:uncharacterized protein LOC129951836 [Eupeodes corollae]
MIFHHKITFLLLAVAVVVSSNKFFDSINPSSGEVTFNMRNINDDKNGRGIIAKTKFEERRSFFHLFNVPYIVCFFAAKGKWPFFPNFMQVQVDQVGRSIFPQSDSFIRNYCQKWIQIKECFRPHNIVSYPDAPPPPTTEPPAPINTEVETIATDPPTTVCSCAQRAIEQFRPAPVVFFDKNYIGNVSAETIRNTIEFLESFLPPPTKKPKRKLKIRERILME